MKTLSLIVLVLSFAITTPAIAATDNGAYSTFGASSCGDWVKARKENKWVTVVQQRWIGGYLSAFNKQTYGVYNILGKTDMESAYLWMDNYCQANPLSSVIVGMEALTDELWPNRERIKDD